MDMVLYSLLKKEMADFEFVSGYKIVEVVELPQNVDEHTIYIVNPSKESYALWIWCCILYLSIKLQTHP